MSEYNPLTATEASSFIHSQQSRTDFQTATEHDVTPSGRENKPRVDSIEPPATDSASTSANSKISRVIYMGKLIQNKHFVYRIDHRDARFLPLRNDLYDHSANGFEWGHPSNGSAQLAIALLADAVSENCAVQCWRKLEKDLISKLPHQWTLTNQEIVRRAEELMDKS